MDVVLVVSAATDDPPPVTNKMRKESRKMLVHMEMITDRICLVRSWSEGGEWGDEYDGVGLITINENEAEGKGFLGTWPTRNMLALRRQLKQMGVNDFKCRIKSTDCHWRWKNRNDGC